MITVVDYGVGNLGSIANMLKRIGSDCIITSEADIIAKAKKILLPGVGAFDPGMERIESLELREVLDEKALKEKIPVLGICLGMQIMANRSEEGMRQGLGWIDANVKRFSFDGKSDLKVPHMGWNEVRPSSGNPLIKEAGQRFYFVHAYHPVVANRNQVIGTTMYGYEFDSVVTNGDNIFGAQFHPEKSHRFGMRFFENFAKL